MAPGSILDLQGTPIAPFASSFLVDTFSPRVIASSIRQGETVPIGTLVYSVQFDEPLDAARMDPWDAYLDGEFTNPRGADTWDYVSATSTLTIQYTDLPADVYRLTLRSGRGGFADLVGHDLDGEIHPDTTVPSGDGAAGGSFLLDFVADGALAFPQSTPQPVVPLGSLIYRDSAQTVIGALGYWDTFSLDLDDHQTLTVVVDPNATLQPAIEVLDPGGVSVGTAEAASAGADAVLMVRSASGPGTYTIAVGSMSGTAGFCTTHLIVNAAVEDESHDGSPNGDTATAQDVDGSFVSLGTGSADRGAVLGTIDPSEEDWYRFTLDDADSTTLALTNLAACNMTLDLYDNSLHRLAVGRGADNVGQIINGLVDGTADGGPDSYFARVMADSQTEYSLVITRNVDFDTEPNWLPTREQDIMPSRTVLGHLPAIPDDRRQVEFSAFDGASKSLFGAVVAISGDTAIVGAMRDDEAQEDAGAAYVYHFDGNDWVASQKLIASDAALSGNFGHSVAIDGLTAIVGASGSDAAYVFRFAGTQWAEVQKLTAFDTVETDRFGSSVAIDGDVIIVGAWSEPGAGAAYVFRFDGRQWVGEQRLTGSPAPRGGAFGFSVAISGGTVVVGAIDDGLAEDRTGLAYVFRFDGAQWVEQQKLAARHLDPSDDFGTSVSISGDTAIVGAPDGKGFYYMTVGEAYLFQFDGSQWIELEKLSNPNQIQHADFGWSVSISGDTAIVGERAGGSDGSGAAFLYHFEGNQWVPGARLTPSEPVKHGHFAAVAVDGHTTVVGAYGSESLHVFTPDPDDYAVTVEAGETFVVTTATPGDGRADLNRLDPRVVLYDPTDTPIAADENGAADGRNAMLIFTAAAAGTYTVRVMPADGTGGEYVLNVTTATAALAVDRHVFYNNSLFDGDDPMANQADDAAIASDKEALLPGQTATFANYTSFSGGINGIMVDIAGLAGTPTVEDFGFKVGNDDDPGGWGDAPAPAEIAVRWGKGAGGSDRVMIMWADKAIHKQWLQVTVLAENLGLAANDVFYFGNAPGECGDHADHAIVNSTDEILLRGNLHGPRDLAAIDDAYDFNRDGLVNVTDRIIARSNRSSPANALKLITVPVAGGAQGAAVATGGDETGLLPAADAEAHRMLSAHDAVFERAARRRTGRQGNSPGKLAWLYDFEELAARRESPTRPRGPRVSSLFGELSGLR